MLEGAYNNNLLNKEIKENKDKEDFLSNMKLL